MIALRASHRDAGLSAHPLRLESRQLLLRGAERSACSVGVRLRFEELRGGLLRALDGARPGFFELLRPNVLLLRKFQCGFSVIDLRLSLHNLLLLTGNLRVDIRNAGFGLCELRFGLGERCLIVALVNCCDSGAGLDPLIVRDGNACYVARHLGIY